MTALYWAVVTTTTVGYGDISPTNNTEYVFALAIILVGVSFYSYIISTLSNQFQNTNRFMNQYRVSRVCN